LHEFHFWDKRDEHPIPPASFAIGNTSARPLAKSSGLLFNMFWFFFLLRFSLGQYGLFWCTQIRNKESANPASAAWIPPLRDEHPFSNPSGFTRYRKHLGSTPGKVFRVAVQFCFFLPSLFLPVTLVHNLFCRSEKLEW
jgi:hypothetical protein